MKIISKQRNCRIQSGLYKIVCIPSGKFYVGSSNHITRRWGEHRRALIDKKHRNTKLQNAWNKYGAEAFTFEIIEFVPEESLLDKEQQWLDEYHPEFNLSELAGSGSAEKLSKEFIVTFPSGEEEVVKNLSRFCRKHGLNRGGLNRVMNGMVNQHKRFKVRKIHQSTEEWKLTLKRSNKFGAGWKGDFKIECPDGRTVIVHSLRDFCIKNGLSQGNMTQVSQGKRLQHKGYRCSYLTQTQ